MGLLDNASAYLAANPDVAAEAARVGLDPSQYAVQHYASSGASEGRSWGADNVAGNQVSNSLSNYTADAGSASGAYLNAYGDVANWANQQVAAGQFKDANEAAAWHWNNSGKNESRVYGVNLSGTQQSAIYDNRNDVLAAANDFGGVGNNAATKWFNSSGWGEGTASTLDNLNYGANSLANSNAYKIKNNVTTGTGYDGVRAAGGNWGATTNLTYDQNTGQYTDGAGNTYDTSDAKSIYYAQNKDKIDASGLNPEDYFNKIGKYAGDNYGVNVLNTKSNRVAPQAIFNSGVVAADETIEGRIKNLLNQNNPVIRQAGDRAMAQFSQRGLLNSSMAIDAANEAMTSKAIEIAGPDAQRYFTNRRENVDWTNKFAQADQAQGYDLEKLQAQTAASKDLNASSASTAQQNALQTNYLQAVTNAQNQMNAFIQQIQAADMDPAAKSGQIVEAQNMFANVIATMKATFKNMPLWSDEWAALPPQIG